MSISARIPGELPAAVRRVAREATQPTADGLLSYAQYLERVSILSTSPRVRIEWIGKSQMGRLIPAIIVTADPSEEALDRVRRAAGELAAAQVVHPRSGSASVLRPRRAAVLDGVALPILIMSGNYGMEASQLEGLLTLAEQLAADTSEDVADALREVAVIIVPTINPDGREIGIEEWSREPLGPGLRSAGNFYEVQVLREYLHLVEPESIAAARLVTRWRPFLLYEVHEDGVGLGWGSPETCLAPPTSPAGGPGHGGMVDMPARPEDNDPALHDEQRRYGRAIAEEWGRRGYRYLHDDHGEHGWPTWPGTAPEGLTTQPETRFTRSMALRGVPAFITESIRIPGSQTWEDRMGQKSSAGRAILITAAANRQSLVDLVGKIADRAVSTGLTGHGAFFLIPEGQDPFIVRRAVFILREHGIQTYEATSRELGRCIVVPRAQPLGTTVSVLLDFDEGRHQSFVASLGLRVIASRTLSADAVEAWEATPIQPLDDVAPVSFEWIRSAPNNGVYTFPNTHHAATLVNRILRSPGGQVGWRVGDGRPGGFVARVAGDPLNLHDLTRGLDLEVRAAAPELMNGGKPLRPITVGVYRGQGITRSLIEGNVGRIRRFLTEWEFSFVQLSVFDITPETLATIDVLIVPEGLADEIVDVPDREYIWHREPWELDEPVQSLDAPRIAALRAWLRAGGSYVGLDAGGGVLATPDYLDLIDARMTAVDLGVGLTSLSLDHPEDPLFDGIPPLHDAAGESAPDTIGAYYHCNPWFAEPGGSVFAVGAGAVSLASYRETLPVEGLEHLRNIDAFAASGGSAAIVEGRYGSGNVIVFGVQPAYRAMYLSTARLLANSILKHALLP